MKSTLKLQVNNDLEYYVLMFVCPGCEKFGKGGGLHSLPVNTSKASPSWQWNGDLEKPTITPSILTRIGDSMVCHSYLTDGVFKFLGDCTHSLANQEVEIPDLPEWLVD